MGLVTPVAATLPTPGSAPGSVKKEKTGATSEFLVHNAICAYDSLETDCKTHLVKPLAPKECPPKSSSRVRTNPIIPALLVVAVERIWCFLDKFKFHNEISGLTLK